MKRVIVKARIPLSVSTETVRRVIRKAGLKWRQGQNNVVLIKAHLKLKLKFAQKVCRELPKDF